MFGGMLNFTQSIIQFQQNAVKNQDKLELKYMFTKF